MPSKDWLPKHSEISPLGNIRNVRVSELGVLTHGSSRGKALSDSIKFEQLVLDSFSEDSLISSID